MCSLTINKTFDEQLKEIPSDRKMIERRLTEMAFEADLNKSGGLDATDTHIQRMPPDLKQIRKKRIGRHRVYYIGFHTQCSYTSIFIKIYKKKGVDDDDAASFQEKLSRALISPQSRLLETENPTEK